MNDLPSWSDYCQTPIPSAVWKRFDFPRQISVVNFKIWRGKWPIRNDILCKVLWNVLWNALSPIQTIRTFLRCIKYCQLGFFIVSSYPNSLAISNIWWLIILSCRHFKNIVRDDQIGCSVKARMLYNLFFSAFGQLRMSLFHALGQQIGAHFYVMVYFWIIRGRIPMPLKEKKKSSRLYTNFPRQTKFYFASNKHAET